METTVLGYPRQLLAVGLPGMGQRKERGVEKAIGMDIVTLPQVQADKLYISVLVTIFLSEGTLEEMVSWEKIYEDSPDIDM